VSGVAICRLHGVENGYCGERKLLPPTSSDHGLQRACSGTGNGKERGDFSDHEVGAWCEKVLIKAQDGRRRACIYIWPARDKGTTTYGVPTTNAKDAFERQ
jgi:hypothetical protein